MSLTSTLPATALRTPAQRFAAMVDNLAMTPVGADGSFGAGAAHVAVWRPMATSWVLSLIEWAEDADAPTYLRTVAVVRDEFGGFDVTDGKGDRGRVLAGGFVQVEAALGYALDNVTAPVWGAGAQDACPAV